MQVSVLEQDSEAEDLAPLAMRIEQIFQPKCDYVEMRLVALG